MRRGKYTKFALGPAEVLTVRRGGAILSTMTRSSTLLGLAAVSLLTAACASPRPVLYPNDQYMTAGKDKAKQDTDDCLAQAKEYVATHKSQTVAKHVGFGAAFGAFIGMIEGAFTGNMGKAAEEGASIGAAFGLAH